MKKYFEILRKCPLFNGIEDKNLNSMLACLNGQVVKFTKGSTVISEGKYTSHVGIVLSGTVQLERTDYDGNRSIVTHIEPSELFAEAFSCAEVPVNIGVVAETECEIFFADCKRIITTCSSACEFHNKMIYNLLKIVATKNIALNQKLEIITKRTTREKLMTFLTLQAKKCGNAKFTIPYDRQQLADYLGVDRSGLSNEISKLRNEGIIKSNKKQFEIL